MTSIQVSVNEAQAHAIRTGKLTVGMVGVIVSFSFDETWDGLDKYAVFRSGNVIRDRSLMLSNETTVPHEVLCKAEERLYIGVEGRGEDGTLVIPTTWADVGVVLPGANAGGELGEDPTPNAYDDIMAAIQSGILRGPEGPKGEKPIKGVDYYTPQEQAQLVTEVLNAADASVGTGPAVVCEAAGEQIGLDDASDWPLKGLHIYGKTTQSAAPDPYEPAELVSEGANGSIGVDLCGKNLIPPEAITISGDLHIYGWYEGKVLPAGTYTVSMGKKALGMYVDNPSDSSHIFMKYGTTSLTFTLTEATNIRLTFYYEGIEESDKGTVQLERGYAATAYEPYCGGSLCVSTPNGLPGIPVSSGGNYIDGKGQQWVSDEIDFARGVYVKRLTSIQFDGSDDEAWEGLYANNGGLFGYQIKVDGIVSVDASSVSACLCNRYPTKSAATLAPGMDGICVQTVNGESYVKVYAGEYYNAGGIDWRTDLKEMPLLCLFQTTIPEEIALPDEELTAYSVLHTNKPNTTVYTDSNAGVKIAYIADTKTYIDNKFAQLSATGSEV